MSVRSGVLLDSTGLLSSKCSGTQLSVSVSMSGSSLPVEEVEGVGMRGDKGGVEEGQV